MLFLALESGGMKDTEDQPVPGDASGKRIHIQGDQHLEVGAEDVFAIISMGDEAVELFSKIPCHPMSGRKVVGGLVPAGISDDDVLVVGEGADIDFFGRQLLLAEIGCDAELLRIWNPPTTITGAPIDLPYNAFHINPVTAGRDTPIDENSITMNGYLDSHKGLRSLIHGSGDDAFGNGIGQSIGVTRGNVFCVLIHGIGITVLGG